MQNQTTKSNKQIHRSIQQALRESKNPLILAHVRPDGDAVGSVTAMGLALKKLNKNPQMVFSDGLPKNFRFLTGSETISTDVVSDHDLVIALDCANAERLSAPKEVVERVHINIDHHVTNERYADINLVLPEYASTTSILADWMAEWGLKITKEIADALLMGMITDTIGFRTDNVTPQYLTIAVGLMEKGADLAEMYHQGLTLHSPESSKVWGYALSRLETDGNLAWTSIMLEDRKRADYHGMDDADLTNHLSSIEGIDISILFNEQKDDKVKVSWRSSAHYDITGIASSYGGGGHPQASGAEVTGQLDDVKKQVIVETMKILKGKK